MDHKKIIDALAKTSLRPLGLKRQGKSRIWYDDKGWWAIVVDFSSDRFRPGSSLYVALSWMFYEDSHWTFDIGSSESGFKEVVDENQFAEDMTQICQHAVRCILDFRLRYDTPSKMYGHYSSLAPGLRWPDYYAGILAALLGDSLAAEGHFSRVVSLPCHYSWHDGLRLRCQDLMRLLREPARFRESVLGIVMRCRSARLLDHVPADDIALPSA